MHTHLVGKNIGGFQFGGLESAGPPTPPPPQIFRLHVYIWYSYVSVPYSGKLLREKTFANFTDLRTFVKFSP